MTTEGQRSGRNNDSVRRDNLATVLGLVHRERSLSRSQLTLRTGLNRSTVAALVSELVERRLVVEAEPTVTRQVGRPSPVVSPDPRTVAVAVNPEIDAIVVALVGLGGAVERRVRVEQSTVPTVETTVDTVARVVADFVADGAAPVGVGVAMPGLVRASDGLVRLAPHLGWTDAPIAELIAAATGLEASAANDAGLGAKAEHLFGAGRGMTDLVYLNGGASGIGGGIIAGGVPVRGVGGFAGEFGHTLATDRRDRDRTGAPGSLELEVRRSALLDVLGLPAVEPDVLEHALVSSTSAEVAAEIDRQLGYLSLVLRNAVDILNPQLIVLGGFLASLDAAAPGRLHQLVREQSLAASFEEVRIARAELGSDLLLIGAAELAFARVLADPARVDVSTSSPRTGIVEPSSS
ncbi:ROK family protein [Marisediminicola sp. LYQ134]|uniref:ROK family protein n=1 Tax=unclassified Marisediminicola TaxID=2618316 RepID=UPI0039838089